MSDTSTTFGDWKDRVTYVVAEAQLLVAGGSVSIAILLVWLRPEIPGIPPIVHGWIAALMLLGPPLLGLFITGAKRLRNRNMVDVYHINGVDDTREKYYVEPGVWDSKTVEGPAPYRVNGDEAFEVREFDWHADQGENGTLIVTGCYFSQLADSKLITVKAMLEDIHSELIETAIAYNKIRGRISKMGVEIERDTVNFHVEADERGLMGRKSSVKDRFEAAEDDAQDWSTDEISDLGDYEHDFDATEPDPSPVSFDNQQTATTDGGQE
ncbi:hypothetical protein [Natrinema halophilum]|uniref:Uncharacterized protein n=1 Tax=Natrinema halophilum TaxID=1699371 RepID=A0A7D5L3N2_9EURY|nr:hypothetical protein [Natrinema halophilum]QLG51085.1 hypothetical protein HYG82_20745 [Natrinema halophilum]